LEFNLLLDQEATALKFGNDKTITSARSPLILYTQKGLPNREINVEVRLCSFGLSASAFLSKKGLQCSKGVPSLQHQRESCSKELAQGMLT
jgi:hypothetical protein